MALTYLHRYNLGASGFDTRLERFEQHLAYMLSFIFKRWDVVVMRFIGKFGNHLRRQCKIYVLCLVIAFSSRIITTTHTVPFNISDFLPQLFKLKSNGSVSMAHCALLN